MKYIHSKITLPVFFAPIKEHEAVFTPYRLGSDKISALHYHSSAELGICLCGEGETHIGNRIYRFQHGDIQIVPPYVPHLSKSDEGVISEWVFMSVDVQAMLKNAGLLSPEEGLDLSKDERLFTGVFTEDEYPELTRAVISIYESSMKNDAYTKLKSAIAVLDFLIISARLSDEKSQVNVTRPVRSSKKIAPALALIDECLDDSEALSEGKLAAAAGMSVASLRRQFVKYTSYPPKSFIIRARMAYAEYLLRNSTMSVIEIASAVGYGEISGFNRTFKRIFGVTPLKYRKGAEF